ncbi:MAG: protein kinase [Lachnospiraceae bacterium]|nr:protein kinase [Lachnospiraceae bacterium]
MRFSPKQMQLIDIIESVWPEYEVTGRLGAGQYGVVFLAVRDDPGSGIRTEEAIKIIDLRSENDVDAAEQMGISLEEYYELKKHSELEEIRTLERLKGASHIIHISDYKVVESEDLSSCYILIRMDAMTSLKKIMAEHEEDSLEEAERFAKKVGLDMCRALSHLQSAGGTSTAHRDIKPDNILRSATGDYCLADFGFARVLQSPGNLSYKGTQEYIAPEVATGSYDHRVDIYSLGLVLYRILNHGRLPFAPAWPQKLTAEDNARSDIRLRTPDRVLPAPDNCSPAFARIITAMCAYDPAKRPADSAAVEQAILDLDKPAGRKPSAAAPGAPSPERPTSPVHEPSAGYTVPAGHAPSSVKRPASVNNDPAPAVSSRPASVKKAKKSGLPRPVIAAAGCLLVLAVIAAAFFAGRGKKEQADTPVSTEDTAAVPVETSVQAVQEETDTSAQTAAQAAAAGDIRASRQPFGAEYR